MAHKWQNHVLPTFLRGVLKEAGKNGKQNLVFEGFAHLLFFGDWKARMKMCRQILMNDRGCVVVDDPKGELWEATAQRQKSLGSRIIRFEPLGQHESTKINPLDFVRLGTLYEVADARNIADAISDPEGQGDWTNWKRLYRAIITALILHVLYSEKIPKEKKNLGGIAEMLHDPNVSSLKLLNTIKHEKHDPQMSQGWNGADGALAMTHPLVSVTAQDIINLHEHEMCSVMSGVKSLFSRYSNPDVAKNTQKSDFDLRDLVDQDSPTTIYLVNDPDIADLLQPLMRMILNVVLEDSLDDTNEKRKESRHPLLLLLANAPKTFGKIARIANTVRYGRKYRCSILVGAETVKDMERNYPSADMNTLYANCILIGCDVKDSKTAEKISQRTDRMGFDAITIDAQNKRMTMKKTRALLTTDEVVRLGQKLMIFISPHAPTSLMEIDETEKTKSEVVIRIGDERMNIEKDGKVILSVKSDQKDGMKKAIQWLASQF